MKMRSEERPRTPPPPSVRMRILRDELEMMAGRAGVVVLDYQLSRLSIAVMEWRSK